MNEIGPDILTTNFKARFQQTADSAARLKMDLANPSNQDQKKLKKAAQEFEALFFKQIIEQMDKTVERGDFYSGGSAEEMFRSMMFDEVAMQMATRPGGSGLGIAEMVYRDLAKQTQAQEERQAEPLKGEG